MDQVEGEKSIILGVLSIDGNTKITSKLRIAAFDCSGLLADGILGLKRNFSGEGFDSVHRRKDVRATVICSFLHACQRSSALG